MSARHGTTAAPFQETMNTSISDFKRLRLIPMAAAWAVALVGCDSTTTVNGRVVLPGVPDASGVVVNAYMGKRASADFSHGTSTTTDAKGAYSIEFTGIGGQFFVTAYAMSTIENVMATSIEVDEGASGTVADLVFTPVGRVSGRVTLEVPSSGNAGSTVAVEGSDMMAVTDDSGDFSLSDVRLGNHRLEAKHDGYEQATVEIDPVEYDKDMEVSDIVLRPVPAATPGTSSER